MERWLKNKTHLRARRRYSSATASRRSLPSFNGILRQSATSARAARPLTAAAARFAAAAPAAVFARPEEEPPCSDAPRLPPREQSPSTATRDGVNTGSHFAVQMHHVFPFRL